MLNFKKYISKEDRGLSIVCHRTLWGKYPENSIAGIKNAIDSNFSIVEIDIRKNIDGDFFLMHDEDLKRTTNILGKISDTPTNIIKNAFLKNGNGDNGLITDESIPSLIDVLNIFKGTKIHPEAKKALQEFDTHVLVFLRKSTEYFAGTWQESIRSGASKSFSSHIKNYNYEGCLKNLYQLRQDFGHDKLHVELYNDPSVSNYNSVDVILKYLRFKDDDIKSSKARINGAVSRDFLESLSIINATLLCKMPRKYRRFIPVLSDQSAHESLSDIEIQTIVNRCEPIEKQIAKDFLGRENMFENSFPDHYKQVRDEYVYTQKNLKEKMFKPLIKIVFFDVYFKKNKFYGWVVFCSIRMLPIKYGQRLLKLLKKSNLIRIS